jgi:hypothetical protein
MVIIYQVLCNGTILVSSRLFKTQESIKLDSVDAIEKLVSLHLVYLPHCNENPIYVFPEKELHGPSLNFHIHVSVSDLYIPRIGPHIYKSLA